MEKLVKDLQKGDKIELLDNSIGIVEKVHLESNTNFCIVYYECGKRTHALKDDLVLILN